MLGFAKAQSLEAVLAFAPTPQPERLSTLGLLWGVARAHARAQGCGEQVAGDAVRLILGRVAGGEHLIRWLMANKDVAELQAWVELGEIAVGNADKAKDSMPALLELAKEYREVTDDDAFHHDGVIPVPGAQLLEDQARRQPPTDLR